MQECIVFFNFMRFTKCLKGTKWKFAHSYQVVLVGPSAIAVSQSPAVVWQPPVNNQTIIFILFAWLELKQHDVLMYTNSLNCNLLHCERIPPPAKASWHIYYNPQCWGCVEKLVLRSGRKEVGKWADNRVYDNVNRPGPNIWCIYAWLQMPFVPKETVYLQYSARKAHKSYV